MDWWSVDDNTRQHMTAHLLAIKVFGFTTCKETLQAEDDGTT